MEPGREGLAGLTTPIAYVTHLFPDPCSTVEKMPFAYYGDSYGWLLVSVGPDGHYDIDPAQAYDNQSTQTTLRELKLNSWDPTNGTQSSGDIWQVRIGDWENTIGGMVSPTGTNVGSRG